MANSRCLDADPSLLATFSYVINQGGLEIRNSIVQGFPQFINQLAGFIKKTSKDTYKSSFASIIISLLGLPNSPKVQDDLAAYAINVFFNIINKVIETLNTLATTFTTRITTMASNFAEPSTVLKAVRCICSVEDNKTTLKSKNVPSIIIQLLIHRKDDLLQENMDALEQAIRVVLELSFEEEFKTSFLSLNVIKLIREIKVQDHEGAKEAIKSVLFKLDPPSAPTATPPKDSNLNQSRPVMISYCWAQKEQMRQVGDYLKAQGIEIWLDIERMEGSTLERMAEAVENCSVMLIGVSAEYFQSQACRTEAEYGYQLKKPMIFFNIDPSYQARSWLGLLLGTKLWYNPWTHDSGFKTGMGEVLVQIQKNITPNNIKSDPQTSSSTSLSSKAAGIDRWKIAEVTQWLEKVELSDVAEIAKEEGWDGRIIIGLNEVRDDKHKFDEEAKDVGLAKGGHRLKLKVELKKLFG